MQRLGSISQFRKSKTCVMMDEGHARRLVQALSNWRLRMILNTEEQELCRQLRGHPIACTSLALSLL